MKFLLVEDDYVSAMVLINIMSPYGECRMAANGLEAITAFKEALDMGKPFDVAIVDIMMPVMDGQEALREIRKIEAERGIGGLNMLKAIMLTSVEDYDSVMASFKDGQAEAFLNKPLDVDELKAHLKKLGILKF
jgi:two-component system chemotaxis response regulator CheY